MTFRPREECKEIVIDLTGPEGNAYNLLGMAKRLAKSHDLDEEEIITEMTSSDYEHLVTTFDEYFGDYVILEW